MPQIPMFALDMVVVHYQITVYAVVVMEEPIVIYLLVMECFNLTLVSVILMGTVVQLIPVLVRVDILE
jgi:hypothetical protein